MIATGGTVCLAEGIIEDPLSCAVYFLQRVIPLLGCVIVDVQ